MFRSHQVHEKFHGDLLDEPEFVETTEIFPEFDTLPYLPSFSKLEIEIKPPNFWTENNIWGTIRIGFLAGLWTYMGNHGLKVEDGFRR